MLLRSVEWRPAQLFRANEFEAPYFRGQVAEGREGAPLELQIIPGKRASVQKSARLPPPAVPLTGLNLDRKPSSGSSAAHAPIPLAAWRPNCFFPHPRLSLWYEDYALLSLLYAASRAQVTWV